MSNNQVHFTLQGKGGVGKSLTSSIIAQYFLETRGAADCFDTDPVNDTFSQYQRFKAKTINIVGEDNNVNSRAFDELMEYLISGEGVAVVDNGASTFLPLTAYMTENNVVSMLKDTGRDVYIHSVITGGQAFDDTVEGLAVMLQTKAAPVVVWINEFFGEVLFDGKEFVDSDFYKAHRAQIHGVVVITRGNGDTFGKDMELMVKNKMTFDEALDSNTFSIMPKQRLKMMKKALFSQLNSIDF